MDFLSYQQAGSSAPPGTQPPMDDQWGNTLASLANLFGPDFSPEGAHEEFLLVELPSLQEHVRILALVIARYLEGVRQCNTQIRYYKRLRDERYSSCYCHYRGNTNQATGKHHTETDAKNFALVDEHVRAYEFYLEMWENRKEELEHYLKALRVKIQVTPGAQGLFNKFEEGTQ